MFWQVQRPLVHFQQQGSTNPQAVLKASKKIIQAIEKRSNEMNEDALAQTQSINATRSSNSRNRVVPLSVDTARTSAAKNKPRVSPVDI
jgi:hypothetical protein